MARKSTGKQRAIATKAEKPANVQRSVAKQAPAKKPAAKTRTQSALPPVDRTTIEDSSDDNDSDDASTSEEVVSDSELEVGTESAQINASSDEETSDDDESQRKTQEEEEEEEEDSSASSDDSDAEHDYDHVSVETLGQTPAPKASNFAQLGISPWLVGALQAMSIRRPTEIQRACIPPTLEGKMIIGGARTGSGKTAAFALPILQRLAEDPYGVFAIVLTPTRELAFQIADQFDALGKGVNLKLCVTVGGMDMMKQALELSRSPHVIVATPGRLADLIQSSSDVMRLSRVKFLVLDEADRLLTPSFAEHLGVIMDELPRDRQTMLYTATLTEAILALQHDPSKSPFVYRCDTGIATVATLRQRYVFVPSQVREVYLALMLRTATVRAEAADADRALDGEDNEVARKLSAVTNGMKRLGGKGKKSSRSRSAPGKSASASAQLELMDGVPVPELDKIVADARSVIVFTGHCRTAEVLRTLLTDLGVSCAALHSLLSQRARLASLGQFKSRQVRVLIATDVGSRGLDIPTVDLVINYDIPRDPADYIHRVGRTARAGRGGAAVSIVSERDVALIQAIEKRIGVTMDELKIPEDAVLHLLSKVSSSKRLAVMQLHDSALGEKSYIRKRKQQSMTLDAKPAAKSRSAGRNKKQKA